MILGIGVDTVDIARFERTLERTPRLLERLFTEAERERPVHSLAGRFAAKEALIKALGGSDGLEWHDMEIERDTDRAPSFGRTERLLAVLARSGAVMPHVSMTHDGGFATAFVVVEAAR
ncbi:holo-ACP synthase [Leucobacter sp. USCH14]|uniref:holo-ACP synthase n=1 Tax=Leucobacter sp. USCH14 TaxID=3024838 RepID=UPI0030B6F36B